MILSVLKKYIWVVNLILIAALAYCFALIVSDKIEAGVSSPKNTLSKTDSSNSQDVFKKSNRPPPLASYKVILQRNVFGQKSASLGAPTGGSGNISAPQTTLNLELLGTFIDAGQRDAGQRSVAIIKNVDNEKVDGYSDGDIINIIDAESVKLISVGNCRAVIERRTQGAETIKCKDITEGSTSIAVSRPNRNQTVPRTEARGSDSEENSGNDGIRELQEGVYEVDKRMLDELLSNPNDILTQARVIPQDDGLRFFAVRPNSIFHKLGIRNADTVHRINNVELSNVENALTLFEELRDQNEFTIDLTRRGKKVTNEYTVR